MKISMIQAIQRSANPFGKQSKRYLLCHVYKQILQILLWLTNHEFLLYLIYFGHNLNYIENFKIVEALWIVQALRTEMIHEILDTINRKQTFWFVFSLNKTLTTSPLLCLNKAL